MIKKITYLFFKFFGFRIITNSRSRSLQVEINNLKILNQKLTFLLKVKSQDPLALLDNLDYSKSQISQDWFVLKQLNYKKNGFFIEIGAASGVELSNTYLLEKRFYWEGLLVEPAKIWKDSLLQNRDCLVDFNCVFDKSNNFVEFTETKSSEYSTISEYLKSDKHFVLRKSKNKYYVKTISLVDLLETYNCPKIIDYISVDTEGSEYDIFKNFDFKKYKFRIATVEHNNTKNKNLLDHLFLTNGYKKVYEEFSQFESWYILSSE